MKIYIAYGADALNGKPLPVYVKREKSETGCMWKIIVKRVI
jgi:hypothetical protein